MMVIYLIYFMIKKSESNHIFEECRYISNTYGYLDYNDYNDDYVYALYAWAKDKKLKSKFMQYRKKRYFYSKKIEISLESYAKFVISESSLEVSECEINSPNGKVRMAMTQFEYELVSDHMDFIDSLYFNCNFGMNPPPAYPYPYIFTEDVVRALKIIGYIDFWFSYVNMEKEVYDDYESSSAHNADFTTYINELRVFLVYFHIILSDELDYKIGGGDN